MYQKLSNDQKCMVEIALLIQGGPSNFSLAQQKRHPGKIHQARWVRPDNNTLLYLYAQTESPSWTLQRLVGFILNVYIPMFLEIKMPCHLTDGSKDFSKAVKLTRDYLKPPQQAALTQVFKTNGYFAHYENILLSALRGERVTVRQRKVQLITESARDRRLTRAKKLLSWMKSSRAVSTMRIFSDKKIFTVDCGPVPQPPQ